MILLQVCYFPLPLIGLVFVEVITFIKQRLFALARIAQLQRLCTPVGTDRLFLYDALG